MIRRSFIAAAAAALLTTTSLARADAPTDGAPSARTLVLVRAQGGRVDRISLEDVRRACLGTPIVLGDVIVRPLLNMSDPLLHDVFLQKVVFMSPRTYERHLLSRVFRLGGSRPARYKDLDELVAALRRNADAISYMWRTDAESAEGIEIITTLWTGVVK